MDSSTVHKSQKDLLLSNGTPLTDSSMMNVEEGSGAHTHAVSEEEASSFLSYVTFTWVRRLLFRGRSHRLDVKDLYLLPSTLNTSDTCQQFQLDWEQEVLWGNRHPLLRAFHMIFGSAYYFLALLKLAADLLAFAGPYFLGRLVWHVQQGRPLNSPPVFELPFHIAPDMRPCLLYAICLIAAMFFSSVFQIHYQYWMNKYTIKVRTALSSLLYGKLFSVSSSTRMLTMSSGEILNRMTIDTERLLRLFVSVHAAFLLPLQIAMALYLLYRQVQYAFIASIVVILLLFPLHRRLARRIGHANTAMMSAKDERVSRITEYLQNIRLFKLNALEFNFKAKYDTCRTAEISALSYKKRLDAWCVYFWAASPLWMSFATFSVFVYSGGHLTPDTVFSCIALFSMLMTPLNNFPWTIHALIESWTSLSRIQSFLDAPEITKSLLQHTKLYDTATGHAVISYENASFTWHPPSSSSSVLSPGAVTGDAVRHLKNLSLEIHREEFVALIGCVGSGKSSFLHSMFDEMRLLEGRVFVTGGFRDRLAYVSGSHPWLQHKSIRDNILFNAHYRSAWYEAVLKACALDEDIALLPSGDLTVVGDQGVTLSLGQRVRISLARAIYSNKDIYLLDDPFSALDAIVAQHIYHHVLLGLLGKKTRVLSTHQAPLTRDADILYQFEGGEIVRRGAFHEFFDQHGTVLSTVSDKTPLSLTSPSLPSAGELSARQEKNTTNGTTNSTAAAASSLREDVQRATTFASLLSEDLGVTAAAPRKELSMSLLAEVHPMTSSSTNRMSFDRSLSGNEVEEEDDDTFLGLFPAQGLLLSVPLSVVRRYVSAMGEYRVVMILVSLLVMQVCRHMADIWISEWIHQQWTLTEQEYQWSILLLTVFVHSISTLIRAFGFARATLRAAVAFHQQLIEKLVVGRLVFFDHIHIGDVLHRCATDQNVLDDSLPFLLNIFLANAASLSGTLIVIVYMLPYMAFSLLPALAVYYVVQKIYRSTAKTLKLLVASTYTPLYVHLQETYQGITFLRAVHAEDQFVHDYQAKLDVHERARYSDIATQGWMQFHTQMISLSLVSAVTALTLFAYAKKYASAERVGFALAYVLPLTGLLTSLIESMTETEKEFVSVERLAAYHPIIETEDLTSSPATMVNGQWPSRGKVTFRDVSLTYSHKSTLALKQVNFTVNGGEHVGILGRTGSGKSSLLNALFRLVDLQEGQIFIDDVDIRRIPLQYLRSSITVIPQSPILLSGTLREFLDPAGELSDQRLWQALQQCQLLDVMHRLPQRLETMIVEGGQQFSVGERQLLCLCKAILKQNRIVCLDEATASIDLKTDEWIQSVLRTVLKDVTVLMIAHRVSTVMGYDKLLVMEKGRMVECDTPQLLAEDAGSRFAQFVKHTANRSRDEDEMNQF